MKRSKRYKAARALVDASKKYGLVEAIKLLKTLPAPKFEQTIDIAVKLGVDPKKSEEAVRGSCSLPYGTGKTVRVLVFAKGEKETEARKAGADIVGGEELIDKIVNDSWLDFDRVVATPDMMRAVGRAAKILGPRGLMPNPKTGTVTLDVGQAVTELKAGKVSFKVDKAGIIHTVLGKAGFKEDAILGNAVAVLETLQKAKPSTSKGVYFRSITLSATMSPPVRLDPTQIEGVLKERKDH